MCLLSELSNKSLGEGATGSAACEEHRFISQRQYKRKLRRDCVTLDRRDSKKSRDKKTSRQDSKSDAENDSESVKLKLISKTTFKLRSTADLTDPDGLRGA